MNAVVVRLCLWVLLALASVSTRAETRWFAAYFGGQQVGHMRHERRVEDSTVITETTLELAVKRAGDSLRVISRESAIETIAGRALGFSSQLDTQGSVSGVDATVSADGVISVVLQQGEHHSKQSLQWPPGALLPEGQRLAALRAGFEPGTHYRLLVFDPSSLAALELHTEVLGNEHIDLPEHRVAVVALRQHLGREDGHRIALRAWVDRADASAQQMVLPALGLELHLRACSKRCAHASRGSADVFASTVVAAPRPLSAGERMRPLRIRLLLKGADAAPLDEVPGQLGIPVSSDSIDLLVDPGGAASPPPTAADRTPNRWLQSEAVDILEFARSAVGATRNTKRRMQRLEAAVRAHIGIKSLRMGYASASEVLALREGDCTEHAVLLAAAARALGIPARVATGIAYSAQFAGSADRFVPHAWVIAWVGEHWHGFDAALPRFDAAHIAFAAGDGDPFNFYRGIGLLGNVTVLEVEAMNQRSFAKLSRQANAP